MITEIVTFPLPAGCDREGALKLYRQTAEKWASNTDLVRKYYFFDKERCLGGGVYIWRSQDAAVRWHGDDYRNMVRSLYGASPEISIFDVVIDVDPTSGSVTEL